MADPPLNHRVLKRALAAEAIRLFFTEAHGGPLVFLWILGAGALWVVFHAPLLAVVLTAALGVVGSSLVLGSLRHAATRSRMLATVLERELRCASLQPGRQRKALESSRAVFLEIAARAFGAEGSASQFDRVLDTACSIHRLQYDAARHAEDHQRVIALLQPAQLSDATLRALATEEASLVAEAGANLDALLVQLLQLSRSPGDLLGMERAAEERAETLHYLQARVELQQQTAEVIRRSMRTRA